MIAFLVLCGVLAGAALALLLPPLIGRSGRRASRGVASNTAVYAEQLAELDAELRAGNIGREQWTTARGEIERRALDEAPEKEAAAAPSRSRVAAVAVGVAVPVVAIALYVLLGTPQAMLPESGSGGPSPHAVTPAQIDAMVERLAQRLKSEPGDSEGWIMLARSYGVLGRYAESASAYANAAAQRPDDSQLLADYADALAMAHGRNLSGEPESLIARSLKLDPNNVKALALAGTAAFERSDYRAALGFWRQALPLVPENTQIAQSVRGGIAEAEARLGAPAASSAPARVAQGKTGGRSATSLSGKVSLARAAAAKVRPEDAVFVYARAAEGPRMPLAILRRQVKDLPFEFVLDDSMAMNPSLKLSDFGKIVVVARVSKSGLATPQKGDLEVTTAPIGLGTQGIRLEIAKSIQ